MRGFGSTLPVSSLRATRQCPHMQHQRPLMRLSAALCCSTFALSYFIPASRTVERAPSVDLSRNRLPAYCRVHPRAATRSASRAGIRNLADRWPRRDSVARGTAHSVGRRLGLARRCEPCILCSWFHRLHRGVFFCPFLFQKLIVKIKRKLG